MQSLIGTYECKTDAKGRFVLASGLKKQLEGVMSQGFVLKRSVFQKCIELYPMPEWNKVMAKVNKLNRFVKKNNDFIRLFTAGVKVVEVDASGRLLLPKELQQFAKVKKELVLASAGSVIEIWDKELYEEAVSEAVEDFAELAEQVMGEINFDEDELS